MLGVCPQGRARQVLAPAPGQPSWPRHSPDGWKTLLDISNERWAALPAPISAGGRLKVTATTPGLQPAKRHQGSQGEELQ